MTNSSLPSENFDNFYGSLQKTLSRECKCLNDTIVIEGQFMETTRDGFALRVVRLALTSKAFVIATEREPVKDDSRENSSAELLSFYPWKSVKLCIFKSSKRKCLKALFYNTSSRYFEMKDLPKTKIFWDIWCSYVKELSSTRKRWPFIVLTEATSKINNKKIDENDCMKIFIIKHKKKKYPRLSWTDKYLHLGSVREAEDQIRPKPVPGLGNTEEIKLLYLKPQYFGCWEQSEHWVQCEESSTEILGNESTGKKS